MFSLLITNMDGQWNGAPYKYSRSRIFERTSMSGANFSTIFSEAIIGTNEFPEMTNRCTEPLLSIAALQNSLIFGGKPTFAAIWSRARFNEKAYFVKCHHRAKL